MNNSAPSLLPSNKGLFHPFTEYLRFCWAGLVNHGQTGGLVPSQRFLIDKMIAPVPTEYTGRIIELGAGTGALTLRLAARRQKASISSCEINPGLAQGLAEKVRLAGLERRVEIFTGSASELLECSHKNALPVDFVISGIPLANLGRAKVLTLLETIHRTLDPGGTFIQFQHSLLDRQKIRSIFPQLRTVPAFLNLPPAAVYIARK